MSQRIEEIMEEDRKIEVEGRQNGGAQTNGATNLRGCSEKCKDLEW